MSSLDWQRLAVSARDVELTVDRLAESDAPSAGFRATELLLAALGACMVGTALEFARRQDLPVAGITVELEDEVARHPTRVGKVAIRMNVDGPVSDVDLERLGRVASRCKVHNTLTSVSEPMIELITSRSA